MRRMTVVMVGLVTLSGVSLAGPNESGVLIVSVNEAISYTADTNYCGQSGIPTCLDADTRVEGSDTRVLHVLAAFPETATPDVAEVLFSIGYDPSITITDYGSCGDAEIPDPGWPASGAGVAVAWDAPYRTERLFEICWFAGSVEVGNTGTIQPGPHPDPVFGGFGLFVAPPPLEGMDPIVDYGRLGFGTDGYLPCPDATPVDRESWGRIKNLFSR